MNGLGTTCFDRLVAARPACGMTCRPGFTMMELVVSVAIFSLVIGGIASAIVIASHACRTGEAPPTPWSGPATV